MGERGDVGRDGAEVMPFVQGMRGFALPGEFATADLGEPLLGVDVGRGWFEVDEDGFPGVSSILLLGYIGRERGDGLVVEVHIDPMRFQLLLVLRRGLSATEAAGACRGT